MDSDQQRQLAEAAGEGDPRAWELLYRNVYPRLLGYAVTRAGVDAGEDLVNETMARAVAGIGRFKWEGAGFDAWLFGILRRVCNEHHRRNKAIDRTRFLDMWVNYAEPGEALERQAEQDAMRQAFAALDDSDRDILALRLMSGLPADEVAKLVGKTPGAVRTAQSRALAVLRSLVRQQQ
ncbi:MAG TPA: sigma-70 family RNA polymerase sigma factor [Acidimicrobiales bacterium]|nr:sigma-70 family RNA polymerase sigma factor [Acidimicrobiales bacterium]